ncbi:peptidylprolyl isomerase [Roseibium album]|nr:peptidylprolyl isomerase [Roseibium album]
MSTIYRFLRQPLLHFLVLGGLIFALYDLVTPEVAKVVGDPKTEIVVTQLQVERLTTEFQAIWQRPPTSEEQQKLIDNFIREEVLVREALRIGLDRDDTVLRRRLVQKMEYLAASAARARKPTDEELVSYYQNNQQNYLRPGRIAFEQIFLGEKIDETLVGEIQAQLNDGVPAMELGKRTLLPSSLGISARAKVDGLFGDGLFERLMDLEGTDWQKPLKSGYGFHLIRITDKQKAEQLSFEEARKFVSEDWSLQKYTESKDRQHEALRGQYRITVEEKVN